MAQRIHCFFWVTGSCARDENCQFKHNPVLKGIFKGPELALAQGLSHADFQALAEAKLQEKVAELQKLEIDAVALKRQIAAMEAREAAKAKKGGRADEPKASRVVPVVKTQGMKHAAKAAEKPRPVYARLLGEGGISVKDKPRTGLEIEEQQAINRSQTSKPKQSIQSRLGSHPKNSETASKVDGDALETKASRRFEGRLGSKVTATPTPPRVEEQNGRARPAARGVAQNGSKAEAVTARLGGSERRPVVSRIAHGPQKTVVERTAQLSDAKPGGAVMLQSAMHSAMQSISNLRVRGNEPSAGDAGPSTSGRQANGSAARGASGAPASVPRRGRGDAAAGPKGAKEVPVIRRTGSSEKAPVTKATGVSAAPQRPAPRSFRAEKPASAPVSKTVAAVPVPMTLAQIREQKAGSAQAAPKKAEPAQAKQQTSAAVAAARPKRVLDSAAVAAVALPAGAATPATSAPVVKRQRVNYVAPAVAAAAPALEAAASNQKPAPVASAYAPATDSPASADDGDAADDDEMGSEPGGEPSDGGTEEPETAWEEPAELEWDGDDGAGSDADVDLDADFGVADGEEDI